MAQLDRFKLTAISWESDKEPQKFSLWMETFSSLVRSTEHGPALEEFLDQKLERTLCQPMAVPSYILNDEDFQSPERASSDSDDEDNTSRARNQAAPSSSSKSGRSAFNLSPATNRFRDLSSESRTLDALLYNILKMNVCGLSIICTSHDHSCQTHGHLP